VAPVSILNHTESTAVIRRGSWKNAVIIKGLNGRLKTFLSRLNATIVPDKRAYLQRHPHSSRLCCRYRFSDDTHVAVHRLCQLRIHLICDGHDIGQQQTEIQGTYIALQRLEQRHLQYS